MGNILLNILFERERRGSNVLVFVQTEWGVDYPHNPEPQFLQIIKYPISFFYPVHVVSKYREKGMGSRYIKEVVTLGQ